MIKFEPKHWSAIAVVVSCLLGVPSVSADEEKPKDNVAPSLSIAELKRTGTVDFEKEILPVLKNNCLACHNQTKAKGDLILETPQTILKGGETGPAVVAGKKTPEISLEHDLNVQEALLHACGMV